jgi:hypothetical protein
MQPHTIRRLRAALDTHRQFHEFGNSESHPPAIAISLHITFEREPNYPEVTSFNNWHLDNSLIDCAEAVAGRFAANVAASSGLTDRDLQIGTYRMDDSDKLKEVSRLCSR